MIENTAMPDETESATVHQRELHDVADLVTELKRLRVKYERALPEEGIWDQMETLERWVESYGRGLIAANKVAACGMEWLPTLRDNLKLAVEEAHRLESEGGNPAGKEQIEKTEEFLRAIKAIDKVIPDFQELFAEHA